jgi:hypothetical protein
MPLSKVLSSILCRGPPSFISRVYGSGKDRRSVRPCQTPHPNNIIITTGATTNSLRTWGLAHGVHAPRGETNQNEFDVAIAPLDDNNYWHLLSSRKNKVPIDLDVWREPNWNSVKYCLAAGYPDEHKQIVVNDDGEKVANQLTCVVAEAGSELGRTKRLIALSSILDTAHDYYFSGMSGGPVYAVEGHEQREVEDEELFPIGIVFQGFPYSGRAGAQDGRDVASAFLTGHDLFFRALTLTPEIFDEWLQKAGILGPQV